MPPSQRLGRWTITSPACEANSSATLMSHDGLRLSMAWDISWKWQKKNNHKNAKMDLGKQRGDDRKIRDGKIFHVCAPRVKHIPFSLSNVSVSRSFFVS